MLSILILTRNEQADLPGCLDSVAFSDDVHVFDSESTDRTAEIARARGAHVATRPFDSYARQRNAALTTLPFKYPWLLILDADERPTPALIAEMLQAVATAPNTVAAFSMRRRDFLWDTWLEHAQMTPFYVRLVRVGRAHYTREINEVLEVEGDIRSLQQPFDHFPFSKGIAHWITKHNTYSTMEAELLATGAATAHGPFTDQMHTALFGPDFSKRRAAQKAIFYSLPGRPLLKWVYLMFVRGAVLDGPAGITVSTLQAIYEYFIELKRREIVRRRTGQTP